jgi:TPR repeat protein
MLGSTEFSCRRTTSTSTTRSSIHRFVPTGRYIRKQSAWKRGFASFSSTTMSQRPKASDADHGTSPRSAQLKGVYLLPDGKLMEKMPLSAVVSDAVRRWYVETEREANRGDVKAMALLGQMLMEGYGCDVDIDLGKKWADKARRRGYRMQRVYCEI